MPIIEIHFQIRFSSVLHISLLRALSVPFVNIDLEIAMCDRQNVTKVTTFEN